MSCFLLDSQNFYEVGKIKAEKQKTENPQENNWYGKGQDL